MAKVRSKIGRMRDRVTIQSDTAAAGDFAPNYSGTLAEKVAAEVSCVKGGAGESYQGAQLEARTDYVVTVRHIAGLDSSHRINVVGGLHDGALLEITAVIPVTRGTKPARTICHCVEVL